MDGGVGNAVSHCVLDEIMLFIIITRQDEPNDDVCLEPLVASSTIGWLSTIACFDVICIVFKKIFCV